MLTSIIKKYRDLRRAIFSALKSDPPRHYGEETLKSDYLLDNKPEHIYAVMSQRPEITPQRPNNVDEKETEDNLERRVLDEEFVRLAYLGVLRREVDPEGLKNCLSQLKTGLMSHGDILNSLIKSNEHSYVLEEDPKYQKFLTHKILENTKFLCAHTPFTPDNLVSVTPALSSFNYYDVHKFRFAEMINFISFLQQKLGNNLNILEVGSYLTTKFIKDLCPQTRISILDIADIKTLEFDPIFKTQDIIDKHYIFDLTRDDLLKTDLEGAPQFDVILLCEVIEHLLVNPKNLIKFLLKFLKEGGYIYITTPNIFQKSYVEAFQQKINPLPIFPAHYSRSEAKHHHVREYSMSELLEIAEEAGAEIFSFYFSPCWDTPPQREAKDLISPLQHDLANIVIVIKKKN